jgi:hypothetical protein
MSSMIQQAETHILQILSLTRLADTAARLMPSKLLFSQDHQVNSLDATSATSLVAHLALPPYVAAQDPLRERDHYHRYASPKITMADVQCHLQLSLTLATQMWAAHSQRNEDAETKA